MAVEVENMTPIDLDHMIIPCDIKIQKVILPKPMFLRLEVRWFVVLEVCGITKTLSEHKNRKDAVKAFSQYSENVKRNILNVTRG